MNNRSMSAVAEDFERMLQSPCPLLDKTHLQAEDKTWATWMMRTACELLSSGEGFHAYAQMEPGWEDALAAALAKHDLMRANLDFMIMRRLVVADRRELKMPAGVAWRYAVKSDEETHRLGAFYDTFADLLMNADDFEAMYSMREFYGYGRPSFGDKGSFSQFNAWFWQAPRTRPYPVPRHGRDTLLLLEDLEIWAKIYQSSTIGDVAAFVTSFKTGSIPVSIQERMREISCLIDRSRLVPNTAPDRAWNKSHLSVCRIHRLLDNIEHLSSTDISVLI